jgi:hypothetical protein
MAVAAPAAKADYHCGPGWFLYYGRCVPYGYGYGYGGPGISLYWGPTYRHYRHHYDYDDWNRHYGRYHPTGMPITTIATHIVAARTATRTRIAVAVTAMGMRIAAVAAATEGRGPTRPSPIRAA